MEGCVIGDDTDTQQWDGDLLGYREIGHTFTNLIKSIDDSKVISIEAGFGRGKTFFREAWAKHLRDAGEVVVEIDAQQSDHSGDPVVTFLGALVGALPNKEKTKTTELLGKGKKFAGVAARGVTKALLRNGAEDIIEELTDTVADQVDGMQALEETVQELGDGMSKVAGQLIAAQLAAEQVRQKEMPEQLASLREALTTDKETDRVVIIIDELDRCHPEYAIALLEAMKLVFNEDGFVFVLMVNADYLERIAERLFGTMSDGESYLEKFVDMRLQLPVADEVLGNAVYQLASELPLGTPFGEDAAFSVKATANLAQTLAPVSGLSMRQIKRVLMKVEIAIRCHSDVPIDAPLLLFLAFQEAAGVGKVFTRARLTPEMADEIRKAVNGSAKSQAFDDFIKNDGDTFSTLPNYRDNRSTVGRYYLDWGKLISLAKVYLPQHRAILNAVHVPPIKSVR